MRFDGISQHHALSLDWLWLWVRWEHIIPSLSQIVSMGKLNANQDFRFLE
jgi:hypothetical protein